MVSLTSDSNSGVILSYIGWMFLPGFATSWLQWLYYRISTRAGDPMPQAGTRRYARDYRVINIITVALYLLYTIYESVHQIRRSPNFYAVLGVPFDVDEVGLKRRFKKLTVLYHPDKAGPSSTTAAYFVHLKEAYTTLLSPTKRHAYDRFGPSILTWSQHCTSTLDYMHKGLFTLLPYYAGSLLFLVILSVLGKLGFGRYWRFFGFFTLGVFELYVVTRTERAEESIFNLLNRFAPAWVAEYISTRAQLLPFETLILARQIMLTFFIAISQIGPLLSFTPSSSPSHPQTASELSAALHPQLTRLGTLAALLEGQAGSGLQKELIPFQEEEGGLKGLEKKLVRYLVEARLSTDPAVRSATGRVLREGRVRR